MHEGTLTSVEWSDEAYGKLLEDFEGLSPGMVGLEDCESLFSHLRTRRMITVTYPVRRFLGVQQLLDNRS